jgi:hypothetical protein
MERLRCYMSDCNTPATRFFLEKSTIPRHADFRPPWNRPPEIVRSCGAHAKNLVQDLGDHLTELTREELVVWDVHER